MKRLKAMDMKMNLSDLPRPILHHILSFLPQKDAVKTSVLSKSWRFLWYGRPNLEICEDRFKGTAKKLISVLDQIFNRYTNQSLSIQQLILKMPTIDPVSARFLEKWIPTLVMRNKGIEAFHLSFHWKDPDRCWIGYKPEYFDLPSVVFKSECLRELYLKGCKLNPIEKVFFRHLQTLRLRGVQVDDEAFERIMSSSPSIQEVSLNKCQGLKTIKVNNQFCSLKIFEFRSLIFQNAKIEIADVSRIETINIRSCPDWFEHHHHHIFTHLKSLRVSDFRLSSRSVYIFSCNFPCLEELELSDCFFDIEEFQLSSRSIKRLAIEMHSRVKVSIDAPNMLKFEYKVDDFPSHFSFTTPSNKWKSKIVLETKLDNGRIALSLWLQKLDELLKVFSQSEPSLRIRVIRWDDECRFLGDPNSPTKKVVKHLESCLGSLCSDFSVRLEVEGEPTKKWNSKRKKAIKIK